MISFFQDASTRPGTGFAFHATVRFPLRKPVIPIPSSDSRHSETVDFNSPNILEPLPLGDGPEKLILARQALLATLLLPAHIPDNALNPILIPPLLHWHYTRNHHPSSTCCVIQ
ncbi:hypothetical protein DEU56DRAFT_752119 [Suillus clintonianus]|uniref:uncharacterized protein n=1 Tax=Suillus clintonianus TaxID=1904413 RepID=UPI001B86F7A9|nr:uncharacterized protein DEU56DRAFT_752119 [Suillus clintonianus]KAG2152828.1 hypothetical protein DEU56DRAFT_752119 [Suillus clintonianus]